MKSKEKEKQGNLKANSMGKVSPKDKKLKTPKQKRRIRNSSNKYLKPGALAQLRYNKALAAKSCTDIGKKRVAVLDAPETCNDVALQNRGIRGSPSMLSPERFQFNPVFGSAEMVNKNIVLRTPKTPSAEDCEFESRLECLPIDLLVFNILFPIWLLYIIFKFNNRFDGYQLVIICLSM